MEEPENLENWLEMIDLLNKKIPMNSYSYSYWSLPFVHNKSSNIGYKIHIPFHKDDNPILFSELICEIYILGVNFKIIKNPNLIDAHGGTQLGKHLVLYPSDLTFLSKISTQSKNILFKDYGLFVPEEEKIGDTRMFTRFCDYNDKNFYNLDTGEMEFAKRGGSLPSFAKLPETDLLFDSEKTQNTLGKQEFDILKNAYLYFDGNFKNSIFTSFLKDKFKTHFDIVWSNILNKNLPIALVDYEILTAIKKFYDELSKKESY